MKVEEIEKIIDDLVKEVNNPLAKKWATIGFKAGIKIAKEYHKQKMAEIMPGDEEIKIEAQKYWQHSTGLLSTWFEKGALWFKSLLTQEEK